MKRPHYSFSKKELPAGSKRITDASGRRVWLIGGEEYPHLRAYFTAVALAKKFSEKIPAEAEQTPAEPAAVEPEPVAVG